MMTQPLNKRPGERLCGNSQGMQSQKDSPVQEQRISELGSLELGLFISKLWPASHKIAANAMQIASNGEIVVQKDFPVQSTHV